MGSAGEGVGIDAEIVEGLVHARALAAFADARGGAGRIAVDLDQRVEAKLQERYAFAQQLIRDNRWFVLAIAHALVTRNTILGDDVDAIYRGTQGVVVNGAWYHDPANRAALEAYQQRALEAHQAQTVGFAGDIPKPPLPPPVMLEATATGDPGGITDVPPTEPEPEPPTE